MNKMWNSPLTWLSRWTAGVFLVMYVAPIILDWYDEKYGFWDSVTHLFPAFVFD
jgi:hypothetical protein